MEKWYVVWNGEILYSGSREQCEKFCNRMVSDGLEIYPESARIK